MKFDSIAYMFKYIMNLKSQEVILMREVADKNLNQLMHESGFNIAKNLKQLRRERNVTQKEVAQHLNIDVTTLSHYETGIRMPDIDTLIALARYYDTDINRIISSES